MFYGVGCGGANVEIGQQLSFFSEPEPEKPKYDLKEWALVYLVTFSGGNRGNLFLLPVEDAKKLCSDKCSEGTNFGGKWHFQWTTTEHFVRQNETYDNRLEDFVFIRETGKQDEDLKRLGIKKPTLKEQSDILMSMGYVPIWKD